MAIPTESVLCVCGNIITARKLKQHMATILHAKRLANKENLVECPCGLFYFNNKCAKFCHLHSAKHNLKMSLLGIL